MYLELVPPCATSVYRHIQILINIEIHVQGAPAYTKDIYTPRVHLDLRRVRYISKTSIQIGLHQVLRRNPIQDYIESIEDIPHRAQRIYPGSSIYRSRKKSSIKVLLKKNGTICIGTRLIYSPYRFSRVESLQRFLLAYIVLYAILL